MSTADSITTADSIRVGQTVTFNIGRNSDGSPARGEATVSELLGDNKFLLKTKRTGAYITRSFKSVHTV